MRRNDNPFAVLGASPRDSRKRLQELRDNAKLLSAQNAADSAYAALIKPEERLAAELRWTDERDSRPLAPLNWAMDELERKPKTKNAADWMAHICECFGAVEEEALLEAVNADREAGQWKSVSSAELRDALAAYRMEIAAALDERFGGGKSYADMLLALIARYECGAERFAGNALIEDVVSRYELRMAAPAGQMCGQVLDVIEHIQPSQVGWGTQTVRQLCGDVRRWHALTLPVRKLRLARGMRNDESEVLGNEIRLFMAELFNRFRWYDDAEKLLVVLLDCFQDCDALQAQLSHDQKIMQEERQSLKEQRQKENEKDRGRVWSMLIGLIVITIIARVLGSAGNKADSTIKQPVYTQPSPVVHSYDPAVQAAKAYLQKKDENLTPLEKKQKEIDAKQEELRRATASGADHAKLLTLSHELMLLRAEYEALAQAEEEKSE